VGQAQLGFAGQGCLSLATHHRLRLLVCLVGGFQLLNDIILKPLVDALDGLHQIDWQAGVAAGNHFLMFGLPALEHGSDGALASRISECFANRVDGGCFSSSGQLGGRFGDL
jgi:hypothetical protein